eukprot:Lithocolla_globosa_v1_NODE_1215_length_2774_cov_14.644722.p1 type:complete len:158 gc:universal NODE_1215_length_2774_cov_14.644722:2247-1774(-)
MDRCSSTEVLQDNDEEFVADPEIHEYIRRVDVCDAVVGLLIKYYQKCMDKKPAKPDCVVQQVQERTGTFDFESWLAKHFQITDKVIRIHRDFPTTAFKERNFVAADAIASIFRTDLQGTDCKLGFYFVLQGFVKAIKELSAKGNLRKCLKGSTLGFA